MNTACRFVAVCCLMIVAAGLLAETGKTSQKKAKIITILMTDDYKFVKEVENVMVGDSVIWKNTDCVTAHSAVCDLLNPKIKKPLFQTGNPGKKDECPKVAP